MSKKQYPIFDQGLQASPQISHLLATKLQTFVQPLLDELDAHLDKRLVATFLALLQTIIIFRDRLNALLLRQSLDTTTRCGLCCAGPKATN
jgi:hypothetical protein